MIAFSIGSQFLQALITDRTGAPVTNAVVTATMTLNFGTPIAQITNASLAFVATPLDNTYNYEYEVPAAFAPSPGTKYQVTFTITVGGRSRTKTFDATVVA